MKSQWLAWTRRKLSRTMKQKKQHPGLQLLHATKICQPSCPSWIKLEIYYARITIVNPNWIQRAKSGWCRKESNFASAKSQAKWPLAENKRIGPQRIIETYKKCVTVKKKRTQSLWLHRWLLLRVRVATSGVILEMFQELKQVSMKSTATMRAKLYANPALPNNLKWHRSLWEKLLPSSP